MAKEVVSIVKCEDYAQNRINNAVKKAISEIKFDIKKGSKILIKPNLVGINKPKHHSITHYTLIDALCKYFIDKKCEIAIGESSAFYQKGYTLKAYQSSRIYDIAKKYNIKLIAFENEEIYKITDKLKFLDELFLPKKIKDFDLIVNVPKLKTHALMRFSGALKNLYGIVPGGYKQWLHHKSKNINDMAEIFLDIYENIKPRTLNIMDAVVGLDGGPSAVVGKPKKIGYILASENPLALDAIACQIIGYSPTDIPTITMAIKRKMINLKNIKQIGNFKITEFKKLKTGEIKDFQKRSIFTTETHTWPTVNNKCNNCKICIEYCPAKAIFEKNGKVVIDKEKCLFCYTCIPKCPQKAIYHKTTFKNKFIRLVRFITGA